MEVLFFFHSFVHPCIRQPPLDGQGVTMGVLVVKVAPVATQMTRMCLVVKVVVTHMGVFAVQELT